MTRTARSPREEEQYPAGGAISVWATIGRVEPIPGQVTVSVMARIGWVPAAPLPVPPQALVLSLTHVALCAMVYVIPPSLAVPVWTVPPVAWAARVPNGVARPTSI